MIIRAVDRTSGMVYEDAAQNYSTNNGNIPDICYDGLPKGSRQPIEHPSDEVAKAKIEMVRLLEQLEQAALIACPESIAEFRRLRDQVTGTDVESEPHATTLTDPETGLVFLPKPIETYTAYSSRTPLRQRDPIGLLRINYPYYIAENLLYSSHIRRIDRPHYRALEHFAYRGEYGSLIALFKDQGILTPEDLEDPPQKLSRQIAFIKEVNEKLIAPQMGTRGAEIMRGATRRWRKPTGLRDEPLP